MPISPIVRILFITAVLVFPGVLLVIHEPLEWLFSLALALFFGIWGACLLRLTLDGAAFDERAFHLTRPDGRRAAGMRLLAMVLVMFAWVALVTALRGKVLHLGAAATIASMGIASTWFILITMAGVVIMHLTTTRALPAWRVPVIIFGPAAIFLRIRRSKSAAVPETGGRALADATMNLHATTLAAALIFILAVVVALGEAETPQRPRACRRRCAAGHHRSEENPVVCPSRCETPSTRGRNHPAQSR